MPKEAQISVVGMNYRVTAGTMEGLMDDLPLRCELEREPRNPNDPNAIKVMVTERPWAKPHGNFHVGYLPREVAKEYAPLMDRGEFPFNSAYLTEIDAEGTGTVILKKAAKKKSA